MKNMFKKTLVAVAIASFATTAAAGTFNAGSLNQKLALEGTVAAGKVVIGAGVNLQFVLGADYIENDVVTVTVTGAPFLATDPAHIPAIAFSGAGVANYIDTVNGNTLRFRMSTQANSTETATLSGIVLDTSGITSGTEISASATAISLNATIGNYDATAEKVIAKAGKQYTLAVDTMLNAVVDVENNRKVFIQETDAADPDNGRTDQDTLKYTITDNAGANHFSATVANATHVIKGADFSFLMECDADDDGELTNAEIQACVTHTAVAVNGADAVTMSVNAELTELTVKQVANAAGDLDLVHTFEFSAPGAASDEFLQPQDYTVSVTVDDGGTPALSSTAGADVKAGKWGLSGSVINVSYMPYQSGITQVINLTNRSNQESAVSVIAYTASGDKIDLGEVKVVPANSITNIAGDVLAKLDAHSDTINNHKTVTTNTRYSFEFVTNAPKDKVELFTSYNVNGNSRVVVVNDSNGGGLSKQ